MVLAKLLIFGTNDPNMRYATGLGIMDPFIWLRIGEGRRAQEFVVVSSLEYAKTKERARRGVTVLLLDTTRFAHVKIPKGRRANLADFAAELLRSRSIRQVTMADNAWASHVDTLRKHGIAVELRAPFFPERMVKSAAEIAAIKRTGIVTQKAMRHALGIIRASSVGRDGALRYGGRRLTSETLKFAIEQVFLADGCASGESIVACGAHAAQPHNTGSGPLRAGELIVIDIFPRDLTSGYYFDMTRTVVKGAPRPELKRLYTAVLRAQRAGLSAVKAGAKASAIDAACRQVFERLGYKTAAQEGFIHSTGHGLGLAIHEAPRLSIKSDETLKAGMVITVEPGLYYKRLGGVRIEDTVVVTAHGCINLTRAPKTLIIR